MTYSIVAHDPESGELAVAVQSHFFGVGRLCPFVRAGVGAVATQSMVESSYGPLGLTLMEAGKSPAEALAGLVAADSGQAVRQVAFVDSQGRVAAHTGDNCISEAGHRVGGGYSVQANMMLKSTVPDAMAAAFETATGDLVDRIVACLEAGEAEGGDIRGRQSAALLVCDGERAGLPGLDRKWDLRIDDHPEPVAELRRLARLKRAYEGGARAGATLDEMEAEITEVEALTNGNPEIAFWTGLTLASQGREEEARKILDRVWSKDENWKELLRRLPATGRVDQALVDRLVSDDKGARGR